MGALDSLHLVAAVFPDWDEARAAERELFELLDVGDADLAVGPAGGDAGGRGPALLAGRFRAERMPEISALVEEHAGTVLLDIPERSESVVVDIGDSRPG
jgi:hypothetical protein